MRSISSKKTIVTAMAVGTLGVLGAGAANAASSPAPSTSTTSTSTVPSGALDAPTPGDTPDQAGVQENPGDAKETATEGPESKGQDTDNIQQGDQHGPDITSGTSTNK